MPYDLAKDEYAEKPKVDHYAAQEQARQERVKAQMGVAVDRATDGEYNPPRPMPERLTLGNVEQAFTYQPWNGDKVARGEQVREALVAAAKAILRNVPECSQRTRVLNHLIDARMIANAAITFDGRF